VVGCIYALASIGLTLIWGVMNFINFASGQFMMLAMYMSVAVVFTLNVDPLIGLTVSVLALFVLGVSIEKTIIVRILNSPRLFQIVATIAIGLILENGVQCIFGTEILSMPQMGSLQTLLRIMDIGPIRISVVKILIIPLSLTLTLILHWFLTRTRVGLGIRAIAQNKYGALLIGVDVNKAYTLTWGLGCAFMGLAGAFFVLFRPIYPTVGWEFILVSFFAVTLGGAGSYIGSFVSALLIGEIEALSGFLYIPAMRQLIYLSVLMFALIVAPRGLFPTREVG
jgi:branched-chain amino acid transport system permease protein